MKHISLLFIFSLMILVVGCQESSSKKKSSSSSNYCYQYPYAPECTGSTTGYTTGSTTSGTTGGTTGTPSCTSAQDYWNTPGCPGFCYYNASHSSCNGGGTTGGTTGGSGTNPFPRYNSMYADKNWEVLYPYVPSLSCSSSYAPSGISYTPYETRQGTITLKGQVNYDPASGQAFFDTTSELLQTVNSARNFFWGDSTLKIRFKSNVQPKSANTSAVCPGRATGMSSIKGYGRIRFDLYLVGRRADNSTSTVSLGKKTVNVNSCTPAIDLSNYAAQFPNGIYLKVQNVEGNQNWLPGGANYWDSYQQAQIYDTYGYVYPQNPYVGETWKAIRNAECWSLDIEVAADGTKTFN